MDSKIRQGFLKYLKYSGIFLVVLACVPFLCFGVVFILYQLEGWQAERMIINEYGEPLAVGETWEEGPFSFTLEQVKSVNAEEWQGEISFLQSRYKEHEFCKAFELEFSFLPKETDETLNGTYTFYSGASDIEGNVAGPLPLPSDLDRELTLQDHHYVVLATKDAHVIRTTVNVPYGEKKYRKIYEFYADVQE